MSDMNFNRSPVVAVGCGCKEGVAHSTQFVSRETYLDVVCSCDGMILYFMILRDQFPDAEIVTWFLGSDQNEPLFAWIRVSLSCGVSYGHGETECKKWVYPSGG